MHVLHRHLLVPLPLLLCGLPSAVRAHELRSVNASGAGHRTRVVHDSAAGLHPERTGEQLPGGTHEPGRGRPHVWMLARTYRRDVAQGGKHGDVAVPDLGIPAAPEPGIAARREASGVPGAQGRLHAELLLLLLLRLHALLLVPALPVQQRDLGHARLGRAALRLLHTWLLHVRLPPLLGGQLLHVLLRRLLLHRLGDVA
mmetsp:Transcript_62289/g.193294  ORF Transcript_62289/g.193294 Transcript_62289/m.193294 type:complete len:200 (-) Transcript_62289:470-1069(-)